MRQVIDVCAVVSQLHSGGGRSWSLVFWECLEEDKMGSKRNSLELQCAWPSSRQEVPSSTELLAFFPPNLSPIHQDQDAENGREFSDYLSNEGFNKTSLYFVSAKYGYTCAWKYHQDRYQIPKFWSQISTSADTHPKRSLHQSPERQPWRRFRGIDTFVLFLPKIKLDCSEVLKEPVSRDFCWAERVTRAEETEEISRIWAGLWEERIPGAYISEPEKGLFSNLWKLENHE